MGEAPNIYGSLKRLSNTDFHLRPLGLQRLEEVSYWRAEGQAEKSVGNFSSNIVISPQDRS
jgi:hypothetical protein